MEEYVVLDETPKNIQKLLNTWRHTYHLAILAVCPGGSSSSIPGVPALETIPHAMVILTRTKKEE